MASCQTSQWVSTSPYVRLSTETTSATATEFTVKLTLQYYASSAANTSVNKSWRIYVAGGGLNTNYGGNFNIDGKTGWHTIDSSHSFKFDKTNTTQSVKISVDFGFNLTWSGVYAGTKSASTTFTIPAKTSYTIKYNANGGSGAPSSQTKWHGTDIKLSTTKPTRSGYLFLGWSTSSTATSATYSSGATYSTNANATLYAVWQFNTYTVKYNANGGTGTVPATQTKKHGVDITIASGSTLSKSGYTFAGWATSSSSNKSAYTPGASYTSNANITLYAVWLSTYSKPNISALTVNRCDSNGVSTESGKCALVKFNWRTTMAVTLVGISWISASGVNKSIGLSTSGTSGSVNTVLGDDVFDTESTYTIKITVEDSGGSTVKSATLGSTRYVIDFLSGGKGVAFGKAAEKPNYVDFGHNALFNNKLAIAGRDLSGNIKEAFQPQNENGNTVIGWGNYDLKSGNTNVYGYDVYLGVSNLGNNFIDRPYRRRGDTVSFSNLRTTGYVTNAGADVTFLVPFAVPIIGSPTVTVTSAKGFVLRQNEKYTHGSAAETYVVPSSYTGSISQFCGVYIVAKFSNTTNVVNNSPIGIYWSGTITFT